MIPWGMDVGQRIIGLISVIVLEVMDCRDGPLIGESDWFRWYVLCFGFREKGKSLLLKILTVLLID